LCASEHLLDLHVGPGVALCRLEVNKKKGY